MQQTTRLRSCSIPAGVVAAVFLAGLGSAAADENSEGLAASGTHTVLTHTVITHTAITHTAITHTLITRVSVGPAGVEGDGFSHYPSMSANARYVAFESDATNLVPGLVADIFVRDRYLGTTRAVDVGVSGQPSDGFSIKPVISASGRFVAFASFASNLTDTADTNNEYDIYVRNLRTNQTRRVTVGLHGQESDGFTADPRISANGHVIAFYSGASNLVDGDTNGRLDIFARARWHVIQRVSVGPHGVQANDDCYYPSISGDGRFVTFATAATNLTATGTEGNFHVYVRDRYRHRTRPVSVGLRGQPENGDSDFSAVSADGHYIAFVSSSSNLVRGDTNDVDDVFVRNMWTGRTKRVSIGSDGSQGNEGTFGTVPAISSNGRFVAFTSLADNLVPGDTPGSIDLYLRDLKAHKIRLLPVGFGGEPADAASSLFERPAISADGHAVAFSSIASNLIEQDLNGALDVFVWTRRP